jgi:hypothetical protein
MFWMSYQRILCQIQGHEYVPIYFPSRVYRFTFTLRSLVCWVFTFCKVGFQLHYFACTTQFSHHQLFNRPFFPNSTVLVPLCKVSWSYILGSILGLWIIFQVYVVHVFISVTLCLDCCYFVLSVETSKWDSLLSSSSS